jgi:hypothetical protein
MLGSKTAVRATPYLQRVIDNRYAQENLNDGLESLQAAYRRASKRKVEPTRDEKVREQVRQAALSITEAVQAIKTGRTKPKPRWGRRVLVVVGMGAVSVAAALAVSEELRNAVLGREDVEGPQNDGASAARPTETVPA